ncbi:uncharacterized protein LY89DRAFT_671708 [Mollisia scopiformis]|uniref:F-box domain-containing protein n=1 Tax=Mollisia scopiformis TaxID=149040 RepID=A0A194X2B9_MOLSC|nr:uncharacterized protein LY89DRAFT_671708 [Mollisia scopiformis]KUJ14350.1 hypothetical protein LY89DRAFT_671708 [Mollisia scopiformis]
MALAHLPNEIFDDIIGLVLPEGFEALALSCKSIYKLSTPFIERHHKFRLRFQKFRYMEIPRDSFDIRTALDLITCIAFEPMAARYIRTAELKHDSFPHRARFAPQHLPDIHGGGPVVNLFASSPYLKQAGLDWKDMLLPNAKTLSLPRLWRPVDTTNKLIDAVVQETKQLHVSFNRPNLAQVTRFESLFKFGLRGAGWRGSNPFLALPSMRSFRGRSCEVLGQGHMGTTSTIPYRFLGETLETAHLLQCCIDDLAIADFLKHTPRLKTLKYSHFKADSRDWNICKFVTAIGREAGDHLIELSVSIWEVRGKIIPGKASMHDFRCLQRLQLPFELVMCNVYAAACEARVGYIADRQLDYFGSFVSDLIPISVSHLSLLAGKTEEHENALERMFRHFQAKKDTQFPALKELHLSYSSPADKDERARLLKGIKKVGVSLHLDASPSHVGMKWEGNW